MFVRARRYIRRPLSLCSPTAWLFVRVLFDIIPLRVIPTIIVSTMYVPRSFPRRIISDEFVSFFISAYWMGGLAPHAANYFKFLLILVLYTICMALFVSGFPPLACVFSFFFVKLTCFSKNFLLGLAITDGGLAILLSALTALYQMTFAGFFVHLNSIPQVLRWLQWMCPLKYTLEALSVNEVKSGLQIKDVLQGVPVDVSATLIMQLVRECIISTSASRTEWKFSFLFYFK